MSNRDFYHTKHRLTFSTQSKSFIRKQLVDRKTVMQLYYLDIIGCNALVNKAQRT